MFYFFFSMTVFAWISLEKSLFYFETKAFKGDEYADIVARSTRKTRGLKMGDTRIAVFFMLFINIAFFGTGNLASVSSFSMESVYRFTTIFDPFLMVDVTYSGRTAGFQDFDPLLYTQCRVWDP
jgi:GPI ethanolamine phosphate transferase 1